MVTRTKKIFVGGLSASTVVEDVKQYFEQFGKVRPEPHSLTKFQYEPLQISMPRDRLACVCSGCVRYSAGLETRTQVCEGGVVDSGNCCWCFQ